jgi:hypothetical protein
MANNQIKGFALQQIAKDSARAPDSEWRTNAHTPERVNVRMCRSQLFAQSSFKTKRIV